MAANDAAIEMRRAAKLREVEEVEAILAYQAMKVQCITPSVDFAVSIVRLIATAAPVFVFRLNKYFQRVYTTHVSLQLSHSIPQETNGRPPANPSHTTR